MAIKGVLVLECLDKSDPGSEGHFISHMLSLMQVSHQYVEVRTKQQLTLLLKSSPFSIIHITTHGRLRQKKFTGLWTHDGTLQKGELVSLKGRLKGCTVICTACRAGTPDFAKEFLEQTKCTHYIAPLGSPYFYNAIFFAHVFYHKHLVLKRSVEESFKTYADGYKNPHKFRRAST